MPTSTAARATDASRAPTAEPPITVAGNKEPSTSLGNDDGYEYHSGDSQNIDATCFKQPTKFNQTIRPGDVLYWYDCKGRERGQLSDYKEDVVMKITKDDKSAPVIEMRNGASLAATMKVGRAMQISSDGSLKPVMVQGPMRPIAEYHLEEGSIPKEPSPTAAASRTSSHSTTPQQMITLSPGEKHYSDDRDKPPPRPPGATQMPRIPNPSMVQFVRTDGKPRADFLRRDEEAAKKTMSAIFGCALSDGVYRLIPNARGTRAGWLKFSRKMFWGDENGPGPLMFHTPWEGNEWQNKTRDLLDEQSEYFDESYKEKRKKYGKGACFTELEKLGHEYRVMRDAALKRPKEKKAAKERKKEQKRKVLKSRQKSMGLESPGRGVDAPSGVPLSNNDRIACSILGQQPESPSCKFDLCYEVYLLSC